jgi:integrase
VFDGKIRSEGTIIRDKSICKNMLFPLLGHQKLSSLTREHIRWWISEVQKLRVNGVDLYSEESFKKAFRLLKAMLNTAYREGIIKTDIVSNIRVKFEDGLPRRKKQSLTFEEVNKILYVSQDDIQFNAYFSLAVSCGMRVGELISLQWKDIDFENNNISVCKSYSLNILQNKVKNGKNFTLPLPELARDRLIKLYEETKEHFNPINLVFKSRRTGKYISPNHLNRKIKKYCKEAKIDKSISNHSLRYTCNTLLYTSGVAPALIQKILNHRSGDLISTHYISVDDDVKKEIVDNIWNF